MASLYRRWEQEQAKRTTKQVVSRHEQELKECTFEPATNAGRIKGNRCAQRPCSPAPRGAPEARPLPF